MLEDCELKLKIITNMGLLDKFKKKSTTANPADPQNMGMLQKLAMKKLMSMSNEEREKLMKKVMTPENIQKHKKDILAYLDQMQKSGHMSSAQVFEAKKKMGLL